MLLAAGRGDHLAYADLYDKTVPAIYGFLRAGLGDSAAAQDATAEVYLQVWRAAPQFDPTDTCAYSLLMFTARRELASRLRDVDTSQRRQTG